MSQVTTFALWQFAKSTHLRKRLREEFGAARAMDLARTQHDVVVALGAVICREHVAPTRR